MADNGKQEILHLRCSQPTEVLISEALEIRKELEKTDVLLANHVELTCFLLHKVDELETEIDKIKRWEI